MVPLLTTPNIPILKVNILWSLYSFRQFDSHLFDQLVPNFLSLQFITFLLTNYLLVIIDSFFVPTVAPTVPQLVTIRNIRPFPMPSPFPELNWKQWLWTPHTRFYNISLSCEVHYVVQFYLPEPVSSEGQSTPHLVIMIGKLENLSPQSHFPTINHLHVHV